jgi:DNA repair protein RadC
MKKINLPKIKIKVTVSKGDKVILNTPEGTYEILRSIFDSDTINWTESMVLVCLNRQNQIIGYNKIASGGFSGVVCDPKVVMTLALQCAASSIILCHNHPSGNLKPSKSDIDITSKIKNACNYLDVKLLDHIIITDDGYLSLANEGHC